MEPAQGVDRRRSGCWIITALLLLPAQMAAASPAAKTVPSRGSVEHKTERTVPATFRASRFLSSLGVNVHIEYTDGKYANAAQVISDLGYIGVDHVRDATLTPHNQGQASYGKLAAARIKFDLIFQGGNIPSSLKLVDALVQADPGSVSSIEGPNEINNWTVFSYAGQTGVPAAIAYQTDLYQAVKADPLLSGTPVFNFTDSSLHTAPSDDNNLHPYPQVGAQPYAVLAGGVSAQLTADPSKPIVLTETGYYTLPNGVGWGGVDDATQAKLTLNLFLDAFQLGVKQTFVYQLLDAYADPTDNAPDKHFGFFDVNNDPKPVATALHNLTGLLQDDGAQAGAFTTGTLNYQISGLPSTGHSLLLEKSSGAYDLVVWNEPNIWDNTTHTEVPAANVPLTVDLGASFASVSVYDPLAGSSPISTAANTSQVQVTVSDHPIVIEVSGPVDSSGDDPTQGEALTADAAHTQLTGGSGADTLAGWAGGDVLRGGDGPDSLQGGSGFDDINGNRGDDTIDGGAGGGDWLVGGQGNDLIAAHASQNILYGNLGNDTLNAGSGGELMRGGQGDDVVVGGSGNDWISGDRGSDTLTGGTGADTFHSFSGAGLDIVTDFHSAEGDRVQLDPGASYSLSQVGADAVVDMGGGDQLILQNVQLSNLPANWIFEA